MNELKVFRASRNLSGADMAKVLKMTPAGYYKIENGETEIKVNHIRKIRDAFNLSLEDISNIFKI